MSKMTKRIPWAALTALLLVFAGCKGESPTAPPPGGSTPPGGTTPPAGVALTLTTSTNDPLVDSTVVITANVSLNGQPVPNGTAVEFSATNGTFTDTLTSTTIRTTTNGVATATLTSATAGVSRITAVVNNVSRTVDVTFRSRPVTPPPVNTTPTVSSIVPAVGRPSGGETIRITGTNLRAPVRVLFDVGGPVPVEGFVVSRSDTHIEVLTPAVNIATGQQLVSRIIVITEAGTANEQRVEVAEGFTFRNEVLTPRISTATPNSGPIAGGTRVSIIGDGFQPPVQVLFGSAEARVIEVRFSEIIVEAPPGRDTNPDGSGTVTGPVTITVRNINSQTSVDLPGGFRYVNKMQITAVTPLLGSALGGTELTIDGTGFDQPLIVTVVGVEARVISVAGTRIRAITGALQSPCAIVAQAPSIFVTNINNGDSDAWGDAPNESQFNYVPVLPLITAASGGVAGGTATITVANPGVGPLGTADIRVQVAGRATIPSPSQITNGVTPTTFTFAIPTAGIVFPTVACTTTGGEPGTRLGPTEVPVTFTNLTTACSDTTTMVVTPPDPNPCLTEPQPSITNISPSLGGCANPPATTVAGAPTTATIVISNDVEAQPLNITSVTVGGTDAASFTVSPPTATSIPAGGSRTFTVTFDPTTAGLKNATATFSTNSSSTPTLTVCLTAQANP